MRRFTRPARHALAATAPTVLMTQYGPAYAAPGDLGAGFGATGRAVLDVGIEPATVTDVAVQPDGKIVAVGIIGIGTAKPTGLSPGSTRALPRCHVRSATTGHR